MVSRTVWIIAGVMWIAEGAAAYITDLNKVGAIILVIIGIGGLIAAFRQPRRDAEDTS